MINPSTTPPATPVSSFHLSPKQIQFFDDNGYLILRQQITGELLERAQEAGQRWIKDGLQIDPQNETEQVKEDYVFARRSHGRTLFRVNYLHNKGEAASLELLGSPQVLAVVESLCGPNFVPTYESMVFKMAGDGEIIPWHQDAVFPRKFRVFNFDLYLDASKKGAGALHVIPGSHKQIHEVCKFAEDYAWNHPDMITVEMEPGDVLLHDDMVLHGSPPVEGKALRRTIYFEFRPVEQILAEGPWDRDWIDKRLRLIPVALKRFQDRYVRQPQFQWNLAPEYHPATSADEEAELRIVHTIHSKGSYCSANSMPTPAK